MQKETVSNIYCKLETADSWRTAQVKAICSSSVHVLYTWTERPGMCTVVCQDILDVEMAWNQVSTKSSVFL